MGRGCVTQGAQLSDDKEGALGEGGRLRREGRHVHVKLIHFVVQRN